MSVIKQNLKDIYERMLEIQSMDLEQFRTKITDQDPNFQGIAVILKEGLYAFEKLNFEEQMPEPQVQPASFSPENSTTTENTNDNQQTQSNQNTISTGTSGY